MEENEKMDDLIGVSTATTPSPYTIERNLTAQEGFDRCWVKLGRSLVYMDYLHMEIDWEPQRSRVIRLCQEFMKNAYRRENTKVNQLYWMQFLERIQDEVENQC